MLLVLKRLKTYTVFRVQKQLVWFLALSSTQLQYFTEQYPCIYKKSITKTQIPTVYFVLAKSTQIKDELSIFDIDISFQSFT